VSAILNELDERVASRGNAGDYNRLGIAAAQLGYFDRAESAFRGAMRADASFINARINLGALQLLQGRDTAAILTLQNAAAQLERMSDPPQDSLTAIYINLARAHYGLEQFEDAERYLGLASSIDPERAAQYSYIASVGSDGSGARAAEVRESPVIFAGDD
jgi:tetratricopeptide (TPR) repeat protein